MNLAMVVQIVICMRACNARSKFHMKLIDLAQEFADLNLFNEHTYKTLLDKISVFCSRSGVTTLDELTIESIARFKKHTLEIAKPVTYNGYIRYLRIVLDYGVTRGLVSQNLFRTIRLAPIGEVPRKVMSHEAIDLVCKHLNKNADKYKPSWFWVSVVYVLYFTGMRRRQLIMLRLKDINFQASQIQLSYEGSKTHRSWKIPVHPEALVRLEDMVWRSEAALGRRLRDDDFIFVASRFYRRYTENKNGSMKAESVTGFFKRLSRDIGISVGAHRFRHTLATEMCNPEGAETPDIFAVQAFLGHTSIQTTRGYAQTKTNRLEAVLDKMRVPFKGTYA